jgi:hypothetical protein
VLEQVLVASLVHRREVFIVDFAHLSTDNRTTSSSLSLANSTPGRWNGAPQSYTALAMRTIRIDGAGVCSGSVAVQPNWGQPRLRTVPLSDGPLARSLTEHREIMSDPATPRNRGVEDGALEIGESSVSMAHVEKSSCHAAVKAHCCALVQ